jgi:hypothetical protein
MTPTEQEKLIMDETEDLQTKLHAYINAIKSTKRGSKIPYEDLITVFILRELAELKINQQKQ